MVRSFTVLDGIGKGLNPRFDISEIAAPYARGCARSRSAGLSIGSPLNFADRWIGSPVNLQMWHWAGRSSPAGAQSRWQCRSPDVRP